MSARPSIEKKLRRLKKSMRTPLPVHFDLVQWLKDHRHAQTTGEAHRLILAGKVRSGSHVIGQQEMPIQGPDGKLTTEVVVQRIQPVKYKDELIVLGESSGEVPGSRLPCHRLVAPGHDARVHDRRGRRRGH